MMKTSYEKKALDILKTLESKDMEEIAKSSKKFRQIIHTSGFLNMLFYGKIHGKEPAIKMLQKLFETYGEKDSFSYLSSSQRKNLEEEITLTLEEIAKYASALSCVK